MKGCGIDKSGFFAALPLSMIQGNPTPPRLWDGQNVTQGYAPVLMSHRSLVLSHH